MAKKDGFTDFAAPGVSKVVGTSSLYHTWDIGTVRVHKAVADGLEPGTEYVYHVGNGDGKVSEQGSFKTAEVNGERTKFLFFGDSQASNEDGFKLWSDIAHKAVSDHPDLDFILQAGDMVEDGFKEKEWSMWFKAAQDIFLQTTLVSVVGNHEVTGTRKNDDFLAHFNNPQNGLDSLKGSNYSFDYHNAHIVVLNSEYDFEEQKEWLRRDLAATDKTWKIVTFHRGPYGSQYDSEHIRKAWTSTFDEFNVDLAMNGHDHVYVRTYPLRGGKPVGEGEGTTYVVGGSSGPKFYPVTPREWQLKVDGEQTQIYGAIEIVGGELKFTVKTIGDRLVDEFTLHKGDLAVPPAEVVIDQPEVNLAVGESVRLNATVLPANAADKTVTWSVYSASADGTVKVTRDGVVTAHEMGTAVVRATSVVEAVYADSLITIDRLPDVKVGEVRLERTEGKLKVGETLQLNATVLPEDVSNKTVIWSVYGAAPDGAAKVSIEALAARGIIDGVGENRFAPQLDITRGDFTVMLVRALGLQASGGGSAGSGAGSGFADINADAYYAEAVGMAKELGFVKGKGDNAFGPRDSVSRQDMFTMAARALEMTGMLKVDGDSDVLAAYTDSAQVSDYAKGSLAGLLQEGLIQGSGSKLNPDSRATRAEVAVFLNRVHNRVYE
ncbi:S-layer homology domain-containing protein [Paenibacillus profundus]|uniref:S-layer homology domain-containing protein n=1 Tax=Paenibacillus profundus TaxID=1173085 RepID=A0ABS8YKP7_9BACL|nr:S-layer homology domain-containing protein [Paenibacillus profundus]MCE5172445.1 S-layer homology domain-containing protein [Paenibacillus profundus]